MDKYKLYNSIKRELLKRPNIQKSDIELKGFSYGLCKIFYQICVDIAHRYYKISIMK